MTEPVVELIDLVAARSEARGRRPDLVGVTGSVAVGKSSMAAELAAALQARYRLTVEIVSTDGFLLPNATLEPLGRAFHKGFPDTYDTAGLIDFLETIRSGAEATFPLYDHIRYDLSAERGRIENPDIVIVEGLNLFGSSAVAGDRRVAECLDERIYVDADTSVVATWFVDRFMKFRVQAASNPDSFYSMFVDMSDSDAVATAELVWDEINGVNLREHIAPARSEATIIVTKADDHSIESIEIAELGFPI